MLWPLIVTAGEGEGEGLLIFSSPEPKAHGELIVYQSSRRPCVRPLTLSNMNISATSRPIATKFFLNHHRGGGRLHQVFGQIGLELWFP